MLTALVVDDEALVRMVVVQMLEDGGYATLEAASSAEAIDVVQRSPDTSILVTDINMPGDMDGVRLAHYVRDRWPPVCLLVLSGRPFIGDLPERALFLEKPVRSGELLAAVRSISESAPTP